MHMFYSIILAQCTLYRYCKLYDVHCTGYTIHYMLEYHHYGSVGCFVCTRKLYSAVSIP